MVTNYAAHYFNEQDRLGTIEPGKLADLTVIDGDYMTIPEQEIEKIGVALVVLGGEVIFETANPQPCVNEFVQNMSELVSR